MTEESADDSKLAEKRNRKRINLLFGIALTLVILMIMLVLAALGFLLYGLIAARLVASIIGVVVCVIGFGLFFVLFRLINKTLLRRTEGLAGAHTDGLRGRFTEALTAGRETHAKVKDELSTRYERAKHGEY